MNYVFHELLCKYIKYLNTCSFMLEFLGTIGITDVTIETLELQCEKVISMLTQGGMFTSVSQCIWVHVMLCVTIRGWYGRCETKWYKY